MPVHTPTSTHMLEATKTDKKEDVETTLTESLPTM